MHAEPSSSNTIPEMCYASPSMVVSRDYRREKRQKIVKPSVQPTISFIETSPIESNAFDSLCTAFNAIQSERDYCRCLSYWRSTFRTRLLLLATTVIFAILFSEQARPAEALKCYETINGKTVITENSSWQYCALVPSTINSRHHIINGTQFGLGPSNDKMIAYDGAFDLSDEDYRVLTVCLFERYDFSRYMSMKPQSAVEFQFRCVCNYDLCNSKAKFAPYLSALRRDSFAAANYEVDHKTFDTSKEETEADKIS